MISHRSLLSHASPEVPPSRTLMESSAAYDARTIDFARVDSLPPAALSLAVVAA